MNRRTLLISAGAAAMAGCTTTSASTRQPSLPIAAELDGIVTAAMQRVGAPPGLAVAVYSREGVYARGFGVTDVTTDAAADADTAFYIASSTKPLTALALAAAAHRGELDLDQTLAAYAPDANFPAAIRPGEVKMRDLLTHTHGIEHDAIVHRTAFSGEHDPQTLWRLLASSQVNDEHGFGVFEYTNVGYNIATILTDARLGVRWQNLLAREVFAPTNMTRTTAIRSEAAAWSVARPHRVALPGGTRRLYLEKVDQTMQSAGGVIMSANDAARWLELMTEDGRVGGRQVIPAEVVRSTRLPLAQVGGEFEGYQRETYGLGWYAGPHRGERMYHHFGGFAGARAHVSYIPERGIGVAAFVNDSSSAFGLPDAIANYIYDRTADREDARSRYDAALDTMEREHGEGVQRLEADRANRASRQWTLTRPRSAYAGAYENDQFGRFEVAVDGETMTVSCGELRSVAEPFTRPDFIRVELVPFSGAVMQFGGAGPLPDALLFQNTRFDRV